MKTYKSIDLSEYNALKSAKEQLQAQTQELLKLKKAYKELESKFFASAAGKEFEAKRSKTAASIEEATLNAAKLVETWESS